MQVKIIDRPTDELFCDWLKLWQKSNSAGYINHPSWFLSAYNTRPHDRYAILTIYEKNNFVYLLPLCQQSQFFIPFFKIPGLFGSGTPYLIDDSVPEVQRKEILDRANKSFGKIGNILIDDIYIETARDLDTTGEGIIKASKNHRLFIDHSKDIINIKHRSKILHRSKKIEQYLELDTYRSDQITEDVLKVLLHIDNNSSKKAKGYNIFGHTQNVVFFTFLFDLMRENIIVNVLKYKGDPVAYCVGFIVKDIYYGYQIAFMNSYSNYALGKAVIVHTIESFRNTNVNIVDFGSGDSDYKKCFSPDEKDLYKVVISKYHIIRFIVKTLYTGELFLYKKLIKNKDFYATYRVFIKKLGIIR